MSYSIYTVYIIITLADIKTATMNCITFNFNLSEYFTKQDVETRQWTRDRKKVSCCN